MTTAEPLAVPPPADGTLALEPMAERHRAPLAAACAEDTDIWAIYATNWGPSGFNATFDTMMANPKRIPFAIVDDGRLVGMTAWIGLDRALQTVEIGNSYLRPSARATGLNRRVKRMLLGHAFANAIRRVIFSVDDRNARSKAAVAKVGGVYEGLLRQHMITWNGHVRDSALFSILKDEWA